MWQLKRVQCFGLRPETRISIKKKTRNKNKPNSVYPSNRFHPKKDSVQKSDGLKQIYCHFQTSKHLYFLFPSLFIKFLQYWIENISGTTIPTYYTNGQTEVLGKVANITQFLFFLERKDFIQLTNKVCIMIQSFPSKWRWIFHPIHILNNIFSILS